MWVPAFMTNYFWAGIKTTQREESINSLFDGFVTRNTKLFEFPQKYARAMEKRVKDEAEADAKCEKYIRRLVSGFTVEKLFQKLYTDTKFQEVQTECTRMMYCYPQQERVVSEDVIEYVLEDRVWIVPEGCSEKQLTNRRRLYHATFNTKTKEIVCECRKFQTYGIMCKHTIRILDKNHVFDIPQLYIVNHWRKDILRKHTRVKVSYHDPNKTEEVKRYNKLMNVFEEIYDEAAMIDEATVDMVLKKLDPIKLEISECRKRKFDQTVEIIYPGDGAPNVFPSSTDVRTTSSVKPPKKGGTMPSTLPSLGNRGSVLVKDPERKKRGRGRPKGSRHKGLAEIGYKKPHKKPHRKKQINKVLSNEAPSPHAERPLCQTPEIKMGRRIRRPLQRFGHDIAPLHTIPDNEMLVVGSSSDGSETF